MEPHASLRVKFGEEKPFTTYRLTGLVVHGDSHFYAIVANSTRQSGAIEWLTKSAAVDPTFELGSMKCGDDIQASLPNGVRSTGHF